MSERFESLRLLEALLFASAAPLSAEDMSRHLPEGAEIEALLQELAGHYANRGVNLLRLGRKWAFRTAPDLAPRMKHESHVERRLSRAAVETLAVVAYHQPVTRAEIEEIRGVGLSRGTLDTLLEAGWIRPKGRRRTPGRPVTWGTSDSFLDHFGLEGLDALPGLAELKAAGLLDTRPAIAALGVVQETAETEDAEEAREDEDAPLALDFGEDLLPAAVEEETGGEAADKRP